jgi:hypothetical protein
MARKTFEVSKLLESVNGYLAAPDSTADGRRAVASMMESILFETGSYGGFRYLELEMHADETVKTLGCESRREYFTKGI